MFQTSVIEEIPGEKQNKTNQKDPPSIKELLNKTKQNKKGESFAQKPLYAISKYKLSLIKSALKNSIYQGTLEYSSISAVNLYSSDLMNSLITFGILRKREHGDNNP